MGRGQKRASYVLREWSETRCSWTIGSCEITPLCKGTPVISLGLNRQPHHFRSPLISASWERTAPQTPGKIIETHDTTHQGGQKGASTSECRNSVNGRISCIFPYFVQLHGTNAKPATAAVGRVSGDVTVTHTMDRIRVRETAAEALWATRMGNTIQTLGAKSFEFVGHFCMQCVEKSNTAAEMWDFSEARWYLTTKW